MFTKNVLAAPWYTLWALGAFGTLAQAQTTCSNSTNLPVVSPGVFNASACTEIYASIEAAWTALLNFSAYPEWNPFVRSQVITDKLFVPVSNQSYPQVNDRLEIAVQLPPLSGPVNASTPSNPLNTQISLENVSAVDHDLYRVSWYQITYPQLLLSSLRWSALSVVEASDGSGNVTLYESREVYDGPLAYVVQAAYASDLQKGFVAQASAFKALLES